MTSMRALWLAAAVGTLGACYAPKIPNGQLPCSAGATRECPGGFTCKEGACWADGTGPSTGGTTGGSGGSGGGTGGGTANLCSGIPQDHVCEPDNRGACDPVCQTGCGPNQRCTMGTSGPACVALPSAPNCVNAACGAADTCARGTICLGELQAACGAHCYRFCRDDDDCLPNARCTVGAGEGSAAFTACSPPIESCNPVSPGARCAQKPAGTFGCYILSLAHPDLAVCDCAGTLVPGQACGGEHQCIPGSECINGVCRRLCDMSGVINCVGGTTCQQIPGSTKYGFCR